MRGPGFPAFAVLVVAAVVGSGCASKPQTPETGDATGAAASQWLHYPDRVPVADLPPDVVQPSIAQEYVGNRPATEPMVALTRNGAAIYAAIDWTRPLGTFEAVVLYRKAANEDWTDIVANAFDRENAEAIPYSDAVLFTDPATGRVYYGANRNLNCNLVAWTDDEGDTWSVNPNVCTGLMDHLHVFTGPPAVLPTIGYPSVVWDCYNDVFAFGPRCVRSFDGGTTWIESAPPYPQVPATAGVAAPQAVPLCDPHIGHGRASQRTGAVYLPRGVCGEPWVSISRDDGLTWTRVRVNDHVGMAPSNLNTPYASVDGHEGRVAIDDADNVYYFWIDRSHTPRLAVSRDGGNTWGPALDVAIPGLTAAKLPAIVAGSEGRVAFSYMGTQSPGGLFPAAGQENATVWNGYIGMIHNALVPAPITISSQVNPVDDPLKRGSCHVQCKVAPDQGVYDYLGIDVDPTTGFVWAAMVDACIDPCAEPGADGSTPTGTRGIVGRQTGGTGLFAELR